ncbi:MAG: DUF1820 family protein [Pseudomonadota bacterium]|nr:DUF1820 family protein [Pseudomonadota bacterium]
MYKVIFHNQGRVYEIYAKNVVQSGMYGFIEVDKLVFGTRSTLVVDPSEEQLKSEFGGVNRTYIPLHAIIRIDEVDKEGQVKVTQADADGANVTPFPIFTQKDTTKR